MAAEAFRILGSIVVDSAQAEQAISRTAGHAESASTRIANAFKKIGSAILTHFAINKIAEFGKECLELAANIQAVESQFSQVFGSLDKEATASLKSVSKEAGIATNRLKGSFVKIASFAKTTGMDTADALSLTERAMIAAADSSAFLDRSIEDTTETLMSFLKGNYENDAALNLSCTEITRNAAANALYGKSFKDLSEAQKQLTLLQMVEDANRLSGALGQAARESDTWTNQVGNLKQAWSDFKATIGDLFLDKAVSAVKRLSEFLVETTEKIPVIKQWLQDFAMKLGVELPNWNELCQKISDGWTNTVWPVIQDLFKAMFNVELPDWAAITASIAAGWTNGVWPGIQGFFKTNFGVELPSWESVKQLISDLWTKVKKGISGYFKAVFSVFTPDEDGTSVAVELAEWWGKVLSALGNTISAVFSIFTEDEDGRTVGERLKEWWDKVLSALGSYISAVFSVFTPDEDGTSVADEIKEWWLKVLGSLGDFISSVFSVKLPSPQDIINKIKSWWDGIKSSLGLSVNASVSTSTSGSSSWSGGGRTSTYTSGGGGMASKPTVTYNAVGAVFSKPTLFDSRLGYQVVGEAGAEAVAPISVLQGYVADAVASQNAGIVNALERVVDAIDNMNDNMGSNLRGALDGVSVGVNKREFGRLVKAVT